MGEPGVPPRSERSERQWAWMSQPRYMRAATASVTKALAWWASAKVYGPGRTSCVVPCGQHLRLDDAGRAVVDRTEHRHHLAVLARVPDEQLASFVRLRTSGATGSGETAQRIVPGGFLGRRRVPAEADHEAAFTAAWATVSRSAKPSILTTSWLGRAEDEHRRVVDGAVLGVERVDAVACARRPARTSCRRGCAPGLRLGERGAVDLRPRVVEGDDDDLVGGERAAGSRAGAGRRDAGVGRRLRGSRLRGVAGRGFADVLRRRAWSGRVASTLCAGRRPPATSRSSSCRRWNGHHACDPCREDEERGRAGAAGRGDRE